VADTRRSRFPLDGRHSCHRDAGGDPRQPWRGGGGRGGPPSPTSGARRRRGSKREVTRLGPVVGGCGGGKWGKLGDVPRDELPLALHHRRTSTRGSTLPSSHRPRYPGGRGREPTGQGDRRDLVSGRARGGAREGGSARASRVRG